MTKLILLLMAGALILCKLLYVKFANTLHLQLTNPNYEPYSIIVCNPTVIICHGL